MADELYPETPFGRWARGALDEEKLRRMRLRAPELYDLVKAALANPESWVEWQREAIAVVDFVEKGGAK